MSWRALNWAEEQRVGHAHSKAVLILLANYADEHATCYPSHEQLGAVLEISVRTIQDCVKRLESDGYVATKRDRLADGKLGLTRYRLRLDRAPVRLADASRPPEAASGGPDSDQPAAGRAESGHEPPEAPSGGPPEEPPAKATGSSFRSEENPPEESIRNPVERDARARGPEGRGEERAAASDRDGKEPDHIPDADLLDAVRAKHPQGAHADQDEVIRIWRGLTRPERRAAADGFDAWLARKGARSSLLGLEKYLRQKLWTIVPETEKGAAGGSLRAGLVDAWSRAWWWLFFDWLTGHAASVGDHRSFAGQELNRWVSLARKGIGWKVDDAAPIEERGKALVQVPRGGREFVAWADHVRRRYRVTLPEPDRAEWVFVPSPLPPADKPAVGVAALSEAEIEEAFR